MVKGMGGERKQDEKKKTGLGFILENFVGSSRYNGEYSLVCSIVILLYLHCDYCPSVEILL